MRAGFWRGWGAARRLLRQSSGAAAIEMAITFPVFLVAVFFVEEAGRVLYSRVELEYALYHAARYTMVATSAKSSAVESAMTAKFMLLSAKNVSSFSLTETTNKDSTRNTTLSVSYDVKFIIPLLSYKTMTLTQSVSFLRASA